MPECCAEWTSFLMTFNRSVRSNLAAHARQEKINKPSCEPMKNIKQIGFPILSSERWKRETALLQLTESALESARNHLVCIRRTFHNHHQTKAKHFLKHSRGLVVLKQNFKIAHIHQFNSIQLNSIQFVVLQWVSSDISTAQLWTWSMVDFQRLQLCNTERPNIWRKIRTTMTSRAWLYECCLSDLLLALLCSPVHASRRVFWRRTLRLTLTENVKNWLRRRRFLPLLQPRLPWPVVSAISRVDNHSPK